MDDLEMTKLCAEAMGYHFGADKIIDCFDTEDEHGNENAGVFIFPNYQRVVYDPLHDDAQAMALVKKFQLCFFAMDEKFTFGSGEPWQCRGPNGSHAMNQDLNRAICKCVAKYQQGKSNGN